MRSALTVARLRPRVGIDDAIGGLLTAIALVLMTLAGAHDVDRAIYGPIDEITHTAYVLAVAKDGIPPLLGRDRAFIGPGPLAPRDVRIPTPDKGSAAVPDNPDHALTQSEAIQPPLYYYAAAPVTWFASGRDKVIALRWFDVFLCLCAVAIIFLMVRDIAGSPLGGGIAALFFASAGGELDIFSFVTNGSMMLTLGAASLWLTARGLRTRRVSWPLVAAAAALAVTQVIVIPLAALALLVPGIAQLRKEGPSAARELGRKVLIAAVPLVLWVLSNLYRYHWPLPRAAGIGGLGGATTTPLDLQQFTASYFLSFVGSIQESFHWWEPSPVSYDWRPLMLLVVLCLSGVAVVLFRGSEQTRQVVGFWLAAVFLAHFTVYCMLYLALVLSGGGDFVYRYFSTEQVAVMCLAGTCCASFFRNPVRQRAATLVVGAVLIYWTYNSAPI